MTDPNQNAERAPYDHPARSIATELLVQALLSRLEPGARAAIVAEARERARTITDGMPNADFFRGRVEAALAEIVPPDR